MSTYLGWNVVIMPTSPAAPAGLQAMDDYAAAAVESPFTKQQQIQDFGSRVFELSVSYASMSKTDGQAWAAFLRSCNGPNCVFQFASAVALQFPVELTTDGSTPRYFRLKGNQVRWAIKTGQIYGVTFEVREAT